MPRALAPVAVRLAPGLLLLAAACDTPKPAPEPAPSAAPATTGEAPPAPTTPPIAEPMPAPNPDAATPPSGSSGAAAAQTSTKDPVVAVKDPKAESERSIKADAGSTVTVYLPKWPGTKWSAGYPKAIGKPKEETIPGFAGPTVPAAAFSWTLGKLSPAGAHYTIVFDNVATTDKAAKPTKFTLHVDVVAP